MEIEHGQSEPETLVERIQYYAAGITLFAIVAVMLYVVTMRYIFSRAPLWGEEVPRIIFIWMSFIFAGIAIRLNLNIRVTVLVKHMSPTVRRINETAMHVLVLILLAIMFWYSLPIVRLGLRGTMLSTGWSNAVFSLPIPIGCVFMGYYQTRRLIAVWRTR